MSGIRQYGALILCFFFTHIRADRFSLIAEAHNMLQPIQRIQFPVDLRCYGYVKGEGIFDSRQNVVLREGQIVYFPQEPLYDNNNCDINDRGSFDAYAIQTRIDVDGKGPRIGNVETRFLVEADFFGRTNPTSNQFQMRLAYLELKTEHCSFLAGQMYHPICYPYDTPNTISFSCGIPISPFALTPQFTLKCFSEKFEALLSVNGIMGDRPFGLAGGTSQVFRNSMMPDFFIHGIAKQDEQNFIGAGFDIYRLLIRLSTNKNYIERNLFTNISGVAFIRFQHKDFIVSSRLLYAQDAAAFELIGGIAVKTYNPVTDERTYTPLRTFGCHVEFVKAGRIEPGLYLGVVKNLGAGTTIVQTIESQLSVYGIGTNIDTVVRCSPRIRWYMDSFIIGAEYEYTRAAYGTIDNRGNVVNTIPVANNRFLFATYYLF